MQDVKEIMSVLKDYRKRIGLTQKQVAKLMNVQTHTVQRFESNKIPPRLDIFLEYLEVLGIEIELFEDIFGIYIKVKKKGG